jgi:hypothetical protein
MAKNRRDEMLEGQRVQKRIVRIADEIEEIVTKDLLLKRLKNIADEIETLITKPQRRV